MIAVVFDDAQIACDAFVIVDTLDRQAHVR
jgi:hypothetical protein